MSHRIYLVGILYFVCLIVISLNKPTTKVDGWGPPYFEERSYDFNYSPRREASNGHAQRKTPLYQGDYYSNPGYHQHHDFYFHRRYDAYTTESYRQRNHGNAYGPQRNNRQGGDKDSDALSRRTIDYGPAENGPQSLGNEKSRYNGKEILVSRPSSKIRKYRNRRARRRREESCVTAATKTNQENTENNEETARALTTYPGQGGGLGHKRSGTTYGGKEGGKGTHSHSGVPKPKQPSSNSNRRNSTLNSDFVFPDNPIFLPKNPKCGEGTTFCEVMDEDYPKDYISKLLKKEGDKFRAVFGLDTILEMNITERVYKDETDLCSSSQRIIFPTTAKNKDEKWQFVINQEGYKQGIGVETCMQAEKPCSMTDGFPLSYRTSCKQKYITRRLLSLNENGGPGMNEFLFPSCCVCTLHSVGLGSRTKTRS